MIGRIALLFAPSLLGLAWTAPSVSIAWSLAGSLFVAGLTQTHWFLEDAGEAPIFARALRPSFMFNFFMIALHVAGGACHALDALGYSFRGWEGPTYGGSLAPIATAQALMLLGHASCVAGMKLVGFRYGPPRWTVPGLPKYALTILAVAATGVSTVLMMIPGGANLGLKFSALAMAAVIVEIAVAVWNRRYANLSLTLVLLGTIIFQQLVSGWKGQVLFTIIPLAALLYPAMRVRVLAGAVAVALVWGLYVYPFGQALRPLLWYQGMARDEAVQISMDEALHMPIEERVEELWIMGVNRLSDLYQFQKYLEFVPSAHPYYGLAILQEALIGLVPRLFWPGKPDLERVSMERVYQAGIVSRKASVSAKASYWQEAYLSGGWGAVLIAGLLLGLLMQGTSLLCERSFGGYTIGTGVIYTGLFAVALHDPQNFLFFISTIWGSGLVAVALYVAGIQAGFLVRVGAPRFASQPLPLASMPARPIR